MVGVKTAKGKLRTTLVEQARRWFERRATSHIRIAVSAFAITLALGMVAQSVEQRIENPCVGGSIPPRATKNSVKQNATPCRLAFLFPETESPHIRSISGTWHNFSGPLRRERPNAHISKTMILRVATRACPEHLLPAEHRRPRGRLRQVMH
jgi:hypothetical protein